jgi:hypothetical protein
VAELPLDDVQRHALAGQLDGVRVAQLVWGEAPPDAGAGGESAELGANGGA